MNKSSKITDRVLTEMYYSLYYEKFDGKLGRAADLNFMEDRSWLKDAAVIDFIRMRNGAWEVSLVFANCKRPLQLIIRNITRCYNERKAQSAAFYIRKEAAKDHRGTLAISIKGLDICEN